MTFSPSVVDVVAAAKHTPLAEHRRRRSPIVVNQLLPGLAEKLALALALSRRAKARAGRVRALAAAGTAG
jgi:hypothetical protein